MAVSGTKNVFWMMRYFKTEPDKGQKFCNMLMQQVELYQTHKVESTDIYSPYTGEEIPKEEN